MLKVKYEILHTALAIKSFSKDELIEIANNLAIRNKEWGLTGSLIYNNREFIQILEGDKDSLENLMTHVKDDTRHGNVHVIWKGEINNFGFSNFGLSQLMMPLIDQEPHLFANPTGIISTGQQLMSELATSLNLTEYAL